MVNLNKLENSFWKSCGFGSRSHGLLWCKSMKLKGGSFKTQEEFKKVLRLHYGSCILTTSSTTPSKVPSTSSSSSTTTTSRKSRKSRKSTISKIGTWTRENSSFKITEYHLFNEHFKITTCKYHIVRLSINPTLIDFSNILTQIQNKINTHSNHNDLIQYTLQQNTGEKTHYFSTKLSKTSTVSTLIEHIGSALNSNENVFTHNIIITVRIVSEPKGTGYSRAYPSKDLMYSKKSIIRVLNTDTMCLARALIISLAHHFPRQTTTSSINL